MPDHIVLYQGKPYGLTLSFLLMEHDQGDPKKYYAAVESSVKAAAASLTIAIGAYLGPAAAAFAGPILKEAVPAVAKGINDLLGTGDDVIGNVPIALSSKELILLATRAPESTIDGIRYNYATPLLTGDGGSYKGYFSFNKA